MNALNYSSQEVWLSIGFNNTWSSKYYLYFTYSIKFVGVSTELLPTLWLATLGLILFLEQNHSSFATLITLTNRIPFVKASLISETAIIVISLVLMNMNYGIGALILTQGLIQLSYNNWKWPVRIIKENDFSFKLLGLQF